MSSPGLMGIGAALKGGKLSSWGCHCPILGSCVERFVVSSGAAVAILERVEMKSVTRKREWIFGNMMGRNLEVEIETFRMCF